jgi:hypothetical protein
MATFPLDPSSAPWRWPFRRARARLTHWTIAAPLARPVLLQRGATLTIEQPRDLEVRCLAGCVWLTLDNDPRDFVLKAHERMIVDRNADLMIQALQNAEVRIACTRNQAA